MSPFWQGFLWPWCRIGWHRWVRLQWWISPPVEQQRCRICEKRRWTNNHRSPLPAPPAAPAPPTAKESTDGR